MKRRDFLRKMSLAGAAVGVSTSIPAAARPNILFFIVDDVDYYAIKTYGGHALTPHLDKMAVDGIKFMNAHASTTVCTPSRYSCMTGRYAGRSASNHFLETFPLGYQSGPGFDSHLGAGESNVARTMRENGYLTGMVGKWHLGIKLNSEEKYKRAGMKYLPKEADPHDPRNTEIMKTHQKWMISEMKKVGFESASHIYWENMSAPFGKHNAEWTIDGAHKFLDKAKSDGRPFYLYLSTTLLHGPDKSWEKAMDFPRYTSEGIIENPPQVMPARSGIAARVKKAGYRDQPLGYTWLDDMVGSLVKKLEANGQLENTLFVFFSDHGSNMKASLYDEYGTRIPLLMQWPDGIKKGVVNRDFVQNIDFVPTFFDIGGVTVPGDYKMDGRSLKPLFQDRTPKDWRKSLYFEIGIARAVRTDEWKYIAVREPARTSAAGKSKKNKRKKAGGGYIGRKLDKRGMKNPEYMKPDQLYNLKKDPREKRNLAASSSHADKLKEMKTLLKGYLDQFPGRPFGDIKRE